MRNVKFSAIPFGAPPEEHECATCAKPAHARLACYHCGVATCLECKPALPDVRRFWETHAHTDLLCFVAPGWTSLPAYATACGGCSRGNALRHCDRCLESMALALFVLSKGVLTRPAIGPGEAVARCVTCMKHYRSTVISCANCLPVLRSQHDGTHKFVSMQFSYQPTHPNPHHFGLQCRDCMQP